MNFWLTFWRHVGTFLGAMGCDALPQLGDSPSQLISELMPLVNEHTNGPDPEQQNPNLCQAPLVDTPQVAKKYFPKFPVTYEKATNILHLI